ncbi:MAG: zinc ribbon domain-containing protein [Clostridia bacterium]|nr:zinc ribbon domain-containing protein [Clostridia bacterium]
MFCEKCGAQNPDNAAVCGACGAPLAYAPQAPQAPEAPASKNPLASLKDNKKVGMIAAIAGGAVALLVLLIVLISSLTSWKAVVKGATKASLKPDYVKLLNYRPKQAIKEYLDDKEITMKEYKEEKKDATMEAEELLDKIDYKFVKCKVTGSTKLKKSELQDYAKAGNYDKVSDGRKVNVKVTYKLDGKTKTDTVTVYVYKINGKWCSSGASYYDLDGVREALYKEGGSGW